MSREQRKPIDVGNGSVCASFGLDGSWLAAGAPHHVAGLLELTGAPAFPPGDDGDGDAVRAYRTLLTQSSHAMLHLAGARAEHVGGGEPRWRLSGPRWHADVEAVAGPGQAEIAQRLRIRPSGAGQIRLNFSGRVDCAQYAEITPVGLVPSSLGPSRVTPNGSALDVSAPGLRSPASASIVVTATDAVCGNWRASADRAWITISWGEDVQEVDVRVVVRLSWARSPAQPQLSIDPGAWTPAGTGAITAGALRYILGCTALTVANGLCCIVTDHRLLPLSWTRDAYYQAALLLACADMVPSAASTVERHLGWLWSVGRDSSGVWQRSHLTTGEVKDPAYQADQQLYPLLELADFRRTTGSWPTTPSATSGVAWGHLVREMWARLHRNPQGLLATRENPADDRSDRRYLLSNQLLQSYVARRLAEWDGELGIGDLRLAEHADGVLGIIPTAFGSDGPFGAQLAYDSDGESAGRRYHDANDVPTSLAPLWGLCPANDPRWLNTMMFAWSQHNPGFAPGRHSGLGSAHTPGVWPLGDAQRWAVAIATADTAAAEHAKQRLSDLASADGLLPETFDPQTGAWAARPWFAWPAALVGTLHQLIYHHAGPWSEALVTKSASR